MGSFFDSFVGSVVYSRLLLPFVFVFCGTQLLEHIVIFVFQLGPEPVTAPQHLVSRLRRLFHVAGDIRCKPGPGSALSLYRATSHRSNVRHTCTCCVRLLYPDTGTVQLFLCGINSLSKIVVSCSALLVNLVCITKIIRRG